jgi:hypothetical protein
MTPQSPLSPLLNALTPNRFGADNATGLDGDLTDLSPEQFLERAEPELKRLIQEHINEQVEPEKLEQYANIRRNDAYWRNRKLQIPMLTEQGFLDFIPVNGGMLPRSNEGAEGDTGFDDYDTAIFKGELRKLIAVIGQRSPGVTAAALRPSDEEQIARANKADEIAGLLRAVWIADKRNRQITLKLGKNGVVFVRTRFVTDSSTYGLHEEPILREVEREIPGTGVGTCPGCGKQSAEEFGTDELGSLICEECGMTIPPEMVKREKYTDVEQDGSRFYARGNVEIKIKSALEVTTPGGIEDLSEADWLRDEYEVSKGKALAAYPILREKNPDSGSGTYLSSSAEYGAEVREQVKSFALYQSNYRLNRWRATDIWIRPWMFELIEWEKPQSPLRDAFKDRFPMGVKITAIGNVLCQVEHECLDEVWTAISPEEGESMYTDPYLDTMIEGDDKTNMLMNIASESAEKSVPITIADPQIIDPRSVKRIGRNIAEMLFSNPGKGAQFAHGFYKLQHTEPRPDLMQLAREELDIQRSISGLTDPVVGLGGPYQTLGEAEMARNQALLVLGPLWSRIGEGWEGVYYRAVMQFCKHSPDGRFVIPLPTRTGQQIIEMGDVSELLLGGWYFKAEEAMPMAPNQIRAYLNELLTQSNPEVQSVLGILDPANGERFSKALGIPGWKIPGNDQRKAIQGLIRELTKGQPMQQLDPFGMPFMAPSIPPDPFLHDPMLAANTVKDWANSEEGMQLQGTPGYENVYLWGKANFDIAQAQMAGGPPPPEGGGEEPLPPGPPPTGEGIPGEGGPPPLPGSPPEGLPEGAGMIQ